MRFMLCSHCEFHNDNSFRSTLSATWNSRKCGVNHFSRKHVCVIIRYSPVCLSSMHSQIFQVNNATQFIEKITKKRFPTFIVWQCILYFILFSCNINLYIHNIVEFSIRVNFYLSLSQTHTRFLRVSQSLFVYSIHIGFTKC